LEKVIENPRRINHLNIKQLENYIFGIRPLMEAIDEGKIPEKIFIQKGLGGANFQQLFKLVREKQIPFQMVPVEKLNRINPEKPPGSCSHVVVDHLPEIRRCHPCRLRKR
jgi:tRNA G18 (ribose-2'-O)-methylase SpoU